MTAHNSPLDPSLMDQFIDGGFKPVEYDGRLVYPNYWMDPEEGDVVQVEWLSAASPRAQGVVLRLRIPERTRRSGEGGLLQWEELEAPSIRLWMRSAGPIAEVRCESIRAGARLVLTNMWEGPTGVDEGLNNFGMLIEPVDDDTVDLHCSDGYGARPDFRDMVVRVSLMRPSE